MRFKKSNFQKIVRFFLANIHCMLYIIQFDIFPIFVLLISYEKPTNPVFIGFLARLKGFEPPASSLGGTHSIQLSYKRIVYIYSILGRD